MPLTFDNQYVLGVVVFMVTMLFCKNLLECLQTFVQVWQTCASVLCKDLFFCPCMHYEHRELFRHSVLAALLTFSVGQPLILVLAKSFSNKMLERESLWTVNLGRFELNATAFRHSQNASAPLSSTYSPDTAVALTCSEVDGILVVMPFTLLAACTTWTWVSLRQTGFFEGDPRWDSELFADPRMQMYELFYAIELFALLCAMLTLVADPAPVEYVLIYATLLCFLLLFFCAKSRTPRSTEGMENVLGMVVFSMLSTLVTFFVAQHWTGSCASKFGSATMLVLFFPILAIIHLSTTDDTRAGYVILTRTCFSCLFSLYFLVLVASNPNRSC
jgi:hypothetical protein